MADEAIRKSYPKIPAKNWWTLRERFANSIPSKVDADYLQSVLGLSTPASAANVVGPLRVVGLIDESGAPTDRALDWRADATYVAVCEAIVTEVYPDSLRSAFPDPSADTEGVMGWFSRNTGSGRSASTAMTSFFGLLCEADPAGRPTKPAATAKKPAKKAATSPQKKSAKPKGTTEDKSETGRKRTGPELNINLQIHIDSSATAEQVDQIFKSMAEHLYGGA